MYIVANCSSGCLHPKVCVSPDQCNCPDGYQGKNCEMGIYHCVIIIIWWSPRPIAIKIAGYQRGVDNHRVSQCREGIMGQQTGYIQACISRTPIRVL